MTPAVYVVAGRARSGKTTIGRALAQHIGATLLDQDVLTNPLMSQIARIAGVAEHDLDHPALTAGPIRRARYQCLVDAAVDNISIGRPAVLVAPFTQEIRDRKKWSETFADLGDAPMTLVWVTVPPEVAERRRRARGLPRDVAANLDDRKTLVAPAVDHIPVDGTQPVVDIVAALIG